jgi:hypothetical protein
MKRRDFLTGTLGTLGTGAACSAFGSAGVEGAPAVTVSRQMRVEPGAKFVAEPARQVPVAAEVDVLVAGGGPAGVGAALAAGSQGAKTLLLERHCMLGGMWTAGLLNPLFDPRKGWLVDRMVETLQEQGAWVRKGSMYVFDVEAMKFLLERMMVEVQSRFWLHCPVTEPIVEDNRVRGVIVESKSGREAVLAKVVIDCTGDGDMAARAGVPFELGRPHDGLCQPMTLMFEVCGYKGFRNMPAERVTVHEFMRDLSTAANEHSLDLAFPFGPQRSGTPYLIATPGKAVAVIQATHVYKIDPTDARQVSGAIVEARRQIHEVFLPAMRRIPGLENLRLAQSAPTIGVREGRRIQGRYRLDLDDLLEARRFDDAVTSTGFHLDVHEIDPTNPDDPKLPPLPEGMTRHTIPRCDIPYRCLLPENVDGLLVAGRCISGTHVAHGVYRVTGTCMGMGQAAGLAAATAAARNVSPAALDGKDLHQMLVERGARFEPRT